MVPASTIFALSSAPGRAGVAVIRVSGPAAGLVLDGMAPPRPRPRVASKRHLGHPRSGERLDHALVLWFPAPRSFTGDDVAELHVHGGRAVTQAVLAALTEVPGCRLAMPGEFARRAFHNGKIDLTEAEGLADLIDAETEAQRRQALRQADGALSRLYEGWRRALVEATALVEAAIDFADEGDVGDRTFRHAAGIVRHLDDAIGRHLDDGHRGEILRDGFHVVLTGPPNVGKSSLLNALARREAAIVSEEAGTTRDVIEVRLDLEGLPIVVSDTAGLRAAQGKVEQEGIRRTLERGLSADLVLWLMDATALMVQPPPELAARGHDILWVANKADLHAGGWPNMLPHDILPISARTGQGIDALTLRVAAIAREQLSGAEHPALTQFRHRHTLDRCRDALAVFGRGSEKQLELRAEDLRHAANALGRLTGKVDPEQVLDQIFKRFCIGK